MSSFKDRQNAFENKYAHDQDMLFKIEARTSKLFGLWVGEQLGLGPDDAKTYATEMVGENLTEPGYDDIKRKAIADFTAKGVNISEHMIDSMIDKFMAEAQAQVESEIQKAS
jgi:hypothetical protein